MSDKVKLMKQADIIKLIGTSVKALSHGIKAVEECSNQCILHFEKHGDTSLAVRLVTSVRDECPGYVVAGLRAWFEKYSPMKFELAKDEEGNVLKGENDKAIIVASKVEEGTDGYVEFNTDEAIKNPPQDARGVSDRANRDIKPMSIAQYKAMITGLSKRLDRDDAVFAGTTPEEKDKTRKQVKAFAARVNTVIGNLSIEPMKEEEATLNTTKESLKSKEPKRKAA